MKKFALFTLILLVLSINFSYSQLKEKDNLLGVSLGLWPSHNAPIIGVNFESNIAQAGPGVFGIGGIFRFFTYTVQYTNGDSRKYTFTSFGFQANYNLNQIGDGKFVPYFGLVLGYNSINNTYTDFTKNKIYIYDVTYTSGMWIWGQVGMRYYFSNSVAGTARIGLGNNDLISLELGVDFKL